MTIPVFRPKLGLPSLPRFYLARPRLDRKWEEWEQMRLVLATAGAGFGKTSFLAAGLGRSGRRHYWYSLDETDGDLATFLAHLHALFHPSLPSLELPEGISFDVARSFLARLVSTLREIDGGIILAIDDLQFVIESREVLRFVEELIRFFPTGSTLILASREPVGLAVEKHKGRGVLAEIRAEDLQFDEQEVEAFFRLRFGGSTLEPGLSRRIVAETEGWAAGIEILFQLLDGSSSFAVREALDRLRHSGSGWFAFFAEEVLSRLDLSTRSFLLRSSILSRLDARLCDRILDIENSRARLSELCRRNLFTFPTGTQGDSYRYHHLFRGFLRDRLEKEAGPTEIQNLLLRAGREFEKNGDWAEAAAAYAEGGEPKATLAVIEKHGEDLFTSGQLWSLRKAFDLIPTDRLSSHADALGILGRLEEIQGRWEEARAVYRNGLDSARSGRQRAEMLSLLAQIHLRRGEYDQVVELCDESLRQLGTREPRLRARIFELLGIAASESGRLTEAEQYLHEALQIFRKTGDESGEGRALFLLAINVFYFRGEFQPANDTARRALLIFQRRGDQRRLAHTLGILGFISMTLARESEARELTERAIRLAEKIEYRMLEGYCHYTLGRCALLQGRVADARREFELVRRIGEELQEPALRTFPLLGLAETELQEGNRQGARAAISRAMALARKRNDLFHQATCHTLAGLAEDRADTKRIRDHWRKAEKLYRSMDARFELHRLLLLRLSEPGVVERNRAQLIKELLAGIPRDRHEFLLLDLEPDRAIPLLAEAIRRGIEVAYAVGALAKHGPRIVPHLVPLLEAESEEVRGRAVEMMILVGGEDARRALAKVADDSTALGRTAKEGVGELARSPLDPLKITALGPFQLTIGQTELSFDQWKSSRALRLFQLLLVRRFQWTPKEVVLEELWPGAEPSRAENNLKQSVLRLRKMLEPQLQETRLSRYVRFRNDAYRLDPGSGYRYDVEEFERNARQPTSGRKESMNAEATRLQKAVTLYRGCFLPESPFEEFTVEERETLRDRFLATVRRLLALYLEAKRWEDAIPLSRRGLVEDPYSEEFYEGLLRAHLGLRHRQEVLATYHKYEEMMTGELGLLPSPRVRVLADQGLLLGRKRTGG